MGDSLFWPGGSGSGGTLVVTAPAGTTVIATNETLGKTLTKRVNDEGIAVLKGLKTGTWMLSATDGAITSTPVPVEIVADYTKTLAFFSAEINVTYPAGSTVTCTCGEVQLVSTQVEDAGGSAKFVVPNAGTWTVTSVANDGSGDTESKAVEITVDGQSENITLNYRLYIIENGVINPEIGLAGTLRTGAAISVVRDYSSQGYIILKSATDNSGGAAPANPVDVTKYSKIVLECNVINLGSGNNCGPGLSTALNATSYADWNTKLVARKTANSLGSQTLECPIDFSGSYYPCVFMDSATNKRPEVYVYNWYLC